ncbi:MAG TPA: VOC family protein [Puia sp.]|nr:VOC family protein [Puia sp.]
MLSDKTIMAFIATTDAKKARPFYEEVLGLPVKRTDEYAIVFNSNGIELRMTIVRELHPVPYSVMSWIVPDIHGMIKGLTAKGVVFEKYTFFTQDDAGVWTAPDGTQVAWFKDPDGNLLSLTQYPSE